MPFPAVHTQLAIGVGLAAARRHIYITYYNVLRTTYGLPQPHSHRKEDEVSRPAFRKRDEAEGDGEAAGRREDRGGTRVKSVRLQSASKG